MEFWVSPIATSVKVNCFGMAVSMEKVQELHISGLLDMYPVFMSEEVIKGDSTEWHRISTVFEADDNYRYVIFGNFCSDKSLDFIEEKDGLDYGYYLVDDISLRPLNEKKIPTLTTNETIVLSDILFKINEAIIEQSSHPQLDRLVEHLSINELHDLKIMGHTDARGVPAYNLILSKKRAEAIKVYLVKKGIAAERIETIGLGDQFPITDNETESNRKLNRRVEIKIIEP